MPRADLRRAMQQHSAEAVAESEARHRALVSALPDGVLLQDSEGNVLLANPHACTLLGIRATGDPADAGLAVPAPRCAPEATTGPEGGPDGPAGSGPLARLTEVAVTALRTGVTQSGVTIAIMKDDGSRLLRVTSVPLTGDRGVPQAVVSTFEEISEQADEADEVRRRADDLFRRTMQHSPTGIAIAALNGRFLRVNRTLCRMLGYRADELQERTLYSIIDPAQLEETSLAIGTLMHGDTDAVTLERHYAGRGGMPLRGPLSVSMVRDAGGRPLHFVVQVQNTSEAHRAQDLLTHLTLHDPLTGLANRTLVLDRIRKALDEGPPPRAGAARPTDHRDPRDPRDPRTTAASRDGAARVAVLQCDVDRFRVVNDSTGQEQGDTVLVEIGRRISRTLQPGDVAGRLGGDEFVVICEGVDEHAAVQMAERLQHEVGAPLAVGGFTITPRISIGIATGTADDDPVDLLRDAGLATRRAKDRGRGRVDVVDAPLRRQALERMEIEHSLRSGIAAGELVLHFQPIVDVGSRAVVGREALLRWNHPERGQLAPTIFLPVAEESGLIVDVGAWVLAEAARVAAAARDAHGYVAVNVSPNQVTRPGLADSVEKALAEAGLPPERLVVELTESVMLSAGPNSRREIDQLHSLGVRIVVDDFGTGFSALSYLRDLPVSGIKVDRSFTAGLGRDPQCDRIVEALTGLAHGLGVDVVVEGVETEQQREMLASIGAAHAQGYLFGRPSPDYDLALVAAQADEVTSG